MTKTEENILWRKLGLLEWNLNIVAENIADFRDESRNLDAETYKAIDESLEIRKTLGIEREAMTTWSNERISQEIDRLEDRLDVETDDATRALLIRDIDYLIHAMGPNL